MGRPLNKCRFGDTSQGGPQLQVQAVIDIGVGLENAWIIKQTGSRRYLVAAEADSNRCGQIELIDVATDGNPNEVGEGSMKVIPSNGAGGGLPDEWACSLHSNTVKTFQGNIYSWCLGEVVADLDTGEAEVQFQ